jgi:hypothetical protein
MYAPIFGRLVAGIICAGLVGQTTIGIAQEVRRALPATPTPSETAAPRAVPVNPGETTAPRAVPIKPFQTPAPGQSILNERIDSRGSGSQNNATSNNTASRGSSAEPDNRTRDQIANDEIRLAPGGGTENASDPAKAQLAIADGLYVRKLYDLAAPEYEKFLGRYQEDSGRARS